MPHYIPTIGLEVHVQLKTKSKMFCGCAVNYGVEPNTLTCPVCLGYPGALPVMNEEALKLSALTGLMLNCDVPPICKFDRKNYFYPDMPKNYQITQFDQPICLKGVVPLGDLDYPKDAQKNIAQPGKVVHLTRIHLEEDVAKSQHFETSTGIDFNRAGTPLMEIVSEPDIDSPEEAFAFLTSLQKILRSKKEPFSCVSDADMEKGQLRCDCNVSVRLEGQTELGVKIEIKNMNSISAVRRALTYEIERQVAALKRGEKLIQSTRRWDDDAGQTVQMRIKESSHDYRYFPDPDLLPVDTRPFMDEVRARRPKLPHELREEFVERYSLTPYDANVLTSYPQLSGYYAAVASTAKDPKLAANYVTNYLLAELSATGESPEVLGPGYHQNVYGTVTSVSYTSASGSFFPAGGNTPVSPQEDYLKTIRPTVLPSGNFFIPPANLAEVVNFAATNAINTAQGKLLVHEMYVSGKAPFEIMNSDPGRFQQVSDTGAIEALCDQAIAASAKAVAEYKAGKAQAINSIKGQVMKLSQGKANPQLVGEILARKLAE